GPQHRNSTVLALKKAALQAFDTTLSIRSHDKSHYLGKSLHGSGGSSRPVVSISVTAGNDGRPLAGIHLRRAPDLHLWDRGDCRRDVPVAADQAPHRISTGWTSGYPRPGNRGTTLTVFGCARRSREQGGRGRHAGDARADCTTGGWSHPADLHLFRS